MLESETERIAVEYQASRNLAQARTQLDALDVANINQWLIYTTEEAIANGERSAMLDALVTLVVDLGLPSSRIQAYALEQNLMAVANVEPTPPAPALAGANEPVVAIATTAVVATATPDGGTVAAQPLTTTTAIVSPPVTTTVAVTTSQVTTVTLQVTPASPTPVPLTQPSVTAKGDINVRTGPGVEYGLAGSLRTGESAPVLGKNAVGDWWEITLATGSSGWVYSQLVDGAGDLSGVAVALNIPTPPPTPMPTSTSVPAPTDAPTAVPAVPAATPVPAPPSGGPDFRLVEKRLWDVVENGGRLDGISVTCGEKRQLVVVILDAAGNRLDGVAVQAIYGAQEVFVSGDQGKGSGIAEFVLGGGQAVKVIRDADGRAVTSDEVYGMSTKPWEIPYETLIGGHFCTDEASCKSFVDQTGCYGHYSWTVTFQRSY